MITRVKCRLYAAAYSRPVLHCDYFAAYERSLDLMNNIFKIPEEAAAGSSPGPIPITIQLCPMKVLVYPTWGADNKIIYDDVDKKLTKRFC